MPATPSRIGFVLEPYRRAVSTTELATERYGNLARTTADPIDSRFANLEDAQERADERQALLSPSRRRFQVVATNIDDMLWLITGDGTPEVPVGTYIDEERGISMPVFANDVVFDLRAQTATFTVWG